MKNKYFNFFKYLEKDLKEHLKYNKTKVILIDNFFNNEKVTFYYDGYFTEISVSNDEIVLISKNIDNVHQMIPHISKYFNFKKPFCELEREGTKAIIWAKKNKEEIIDEILCQKECGVKIKNLTIYKK